jgi:processive rubber oxygenase RoxA-like protein
VILWDYSSDGKPIHSPPLRTREDWIRAGEMVFDSPIAWDDSEVQLLRDPATYEKTGMRLTKDGRLPYLQYVIRKTGQVEVGDDACATCHSRLMEDGSVIKGAQGNNPFERFNALYDRILSADPRQAQSLLEEERLGLLQNYLAPWLDEDPHMRLKGFTMSEIGAVFQTIPPGVQARTGTSLFYPPQVPDIIGVEARHYLDHTGLVRQRSIGDLMRYAALNQAIDRLSRFGDFQPAAVSFPIALTDPTRLPAAKFAARYSDAQLYALALYVYSLRPPPNPNRVDQTAALGERVFHREGCPLCHTPPLYSNNRLTPAGNFEPPEAHLSLFEILPVRVGTDPNLALRTRRGTGYYKVPSLRGVWYRGPFEHNGSVATLEDWFDSRRLREDYVPTGFVGYGHKTRAVSGHEYGLRLPQAEKAALIAFLRTL